MSIFMITLLQKQGFCGKSTLLKEMVPQKKSSNGDHQENHLFNEVDLSTVAN
jgi:hypothetical protein